MNVEDKIRISVAKRTADVFLRSDFSKFGSEAQVGRALRRLIGDGIIVKLGVGVYAKAKRNVLSGQPMPIRPVDVLAEQALEKMGVKIFPSTITDDYNAGRTTQMPVVTAINTGDRRIRRKLGFGSRTVYYENNRSKTARSY
jgi:hypothetical protein